MTSMFWKEEKEVKPIIRNRVGKFEFRQKKDRLFLRGFAT